MSALHVSLIFLLGATTAVSGSGCTRRDDDPVRIEGGPIRIMLDAPPVTLNPRMSMDATGQRLGALLFGALTRMDSDLKPRPDLSESWRVSESGRTYHFLMRQGLKDQAGEPIDAARMAACLEQYRLGKPISPIRAAFPAWKATRSDNNHVIVELERPDPYLPKNLSLVRYFRVEGESVPCSEPRPGSPLIGSGWFRMKKWDPRPTQELRLIPIDSNYRQVQFLFVRDDNTRALKLLKGDVDLTQNALSLSKSNWIRAEHSDRFRVFERDGVNVSYLVFNLRDPILSRPEVRQALSLAIAREDIVDNKLFRFCKVAGSFLSPILEESYRSTYPYDPARAEALLDQAGFPRDKDGVRLRLKFKTSPVRDAIEIVFVLQGMLRKIGVELELEVVEPAVLMASFKKGNHQLSLSRWIGVADGSILYRALHSSQPGNRAGYRDAKMDRWLEQAMSEPDKDKRIALLKEVQMKMAEDLPYLPLWYWNNAIIARRSLSDDAKKMKISLSGSLEPLVYLGTQ